MPKENTHKHREGDPSKGSSGQHEGHEMHEGHQEMKHGDHKNRKSHEGHKNGDHPGNRGSARAPDVAVLTGLRQKTGARSQ
jgi:hypothetical protein